MVKAVQIQRKTLLAAVLALTFVACLPKPEEEVDWVRSDASIIVHMKTVADPESELDQRATVPEFTLYGDGTLITSDGENVRQAHLDDGEVRDLLEYLHDQGYFDFDYAQPSPEGQSSDATYVLATTKEAQNAARACGLDTESPEGGKWRPFRRLQSIRERLLDIDGEGVRDYQPESWVLFVRSVEPRITGPVPEEWPLPEIDLAAVASGSGQTALTVDQARTLEQTLRGGFVSQGQPFEIAFRPHLPHEDNFPEFDLPPVDGGTSFGAHLPGC